MTFNKNTNTVKTQATGIRNIDALMAHKRWSSNRVTFSFTNNFRNDYERGYPDSNTHKPSFQSLNAKQKQAVRYWMKQYNNVSDLKLVELKGKSDRDATLRLAESNDASTAYAYIPFGNGGKNNATEAGDIWFNTSDFNNPVMGNYAHVTFGHEIGHALGLLHPHDGDGPTRDTVSKRRDSVEFSIMSYRSFIGGSVFGAYTNGVSGFPQSLMMLDIRAIQEMYGADFKYNNKNTKYKFSTKDGTMSIDGKAQKSPLRNRIFRTIWDGNGKDTYDFSNYDTATSIDLRPGRWSNLDKKGKAQLANLGRGNVARGHVFNAMQYQGDARSLIENAKGGSNRDKIQGNIADNKLSGNKGNDDIVGGKGQDTLWGDRGNDRLIGGDNRDRLIGGTGNDWMYGGDKGDVIKLGQGNDTLTFKHRNDGNDKIFGFEGRGSDADLLRFKASGFKSTKQGVRGLEKGGNISKYLVRGNDSLGSRSGFRFQSGDLFFDGNGGRSDGNMELIAQINSPKTAISFNHLNQNSITIF